MNDQKNGAEGTKNKKGCLQFFIVAILLFAAIGFFTDKEPPQNTDSTVVQKAWYNGGNLHQANALAWQDANYTNKLATAADFIATLLKGEKFKKNLQEKIASIEDIKPFAKELVTFIDKATEKNPDPELNKKAYTNQKISDMALMGMMMMGWTQ